MFRTRFFLSLEIGTDNPINNAAMVGLNFLILTISIHLPSSQVGTLELMGPVGALMYLALK